MNIFLRKLTLFCQIGVARGQPGLDRHGEYYGPLRQSQSHSQYRHPEGGGVLVRVCWLLIHFLPSGEENFLSTLSLLFLPAWVPSLRENLRRKRQPWL